MARNKEKSKRFTETTKQSRMITNLQRVVDDVIHTCNLYGSVHMDYDRSKTLTVKVELKDYDNEVVFNQKIERGTQAYSKWVNEVIGLEQAVLKFGIKYDGGDQ